MVCNGVCLMMELAIVLCEPGIPSKHNITTTHVTTPFAKEDLKRAFFAEIYCLHASVPLLMYFFPKLSHHFLQLVSYRGGA